MLKVLTFPLTIVTFGLFLLVINALMIMLASSMLEGFHVGPPVVWSFMCTISRPHTSHDHGS